MKKLTLLLTSLMLSSCISFYDIKGTSPRLMPATQEVYHNNIGNYKYGEACVTNILWLFAFGDSSIETAAKNGNIKKVASVYTTYNHFLFYLPFYQKGCTVVVGEEK